MGLSAFWRETKETVAQAWNAFLYASPARIWAIMFGAPPLTGLAAWVIYLLAGLATAPDPVRVPIVLAIANMGYIVLAIVLVIVCALAAVSLVVRGPNGWQIGVNDDEDEPPATVIRTTTETEVMPAPPKKEEEA